MTVTFDTFSVCLDVIIRPCRARDLPALEWFGLFESHRGLIRAVFERQREGEAMMLVVEANGEPSGQLWIDLSRRRRDATGVIWAVRVLPCLQRLGIGTRLMDTAEAILRRDGFERSEVTVELDNEGARRLYERLGYTVTGSILASHPPGAVVTSDCEDSGEPVTRQWVLQKELQADCPSQVEEDEACGRRP